MWDLPGPGLEPVSPALAGGFLTTAPPGRPLLLFYVLVFWPRGTRDLSPPTRGPTRTPCIGRWSLNHWTAREVPFLYVFFKKICSYNLFLTSHSPTSCSSCSKTLSQIFDSFVFPLLFVISHLDLEYASPLLHRHRNVLCQFPSPPNP